MKQIDITGALVTVKVRGRSVDEVLKKGVRKFVKFVEPHFDEGTTLHYTITSIYENDKKGTWAVTIQFEEVTKKKTVGKGKKKDASKPFNTYIAQQRKRI